MSVWAAQSRSTVLIKPPITADHRSRGQQKGSVVPTGSGWFS